MTNAIPSKKVASHTSKAKQSTPTSDPTFQDRFRGYYLSHYQAFKMGFKNIATTPLATIITIAAIGVCLSLPMSLYLFVKNMQQLSQGLGEGCAISLYLNPKSTPLQVNNILSKVKQYPFVEKATYLSPADALKEFQAISKLNDALNLLSENPLPGVINIELDSKKVPKEKLEEMKNDLAKMPNVNAAALDYEWVEKLSAFLTFGKTLSHFLYLIIGFGVILMVGNTLKLAMERHRDEIEVLSLVGATKAFIRRPFLYRGVLYGSLGGVIGLLILTITIAFLKTPTASLVSLYDGIFSLENLGFYDTVAFLTASAGLGWLGAAIAFSQQQQSAFQPS